MRSSIALHRTSVDALQDGSAGLMFGTLRGRRRPALDERKSPTDQESPQQTKPKKGQFMNFSRGHSGTKVRCESCLFSKEKHQNSQQKWAKFMNFSFWPFLWFGLPGRLPNRTTRFESHDDSEEKFQHAS